MERHEIRTARWKTVLLVLGLLAFVLLGMAIVVFGNLVEKAAGVLCIVFFGGFGGYALYLKAQGFGKLAILPSGVEFAMFSPVPRVIPWTDIEAFGVLKVAKQEFTSIRLRSYESLVANLSDLEADRAAKWFQSFRVMGYAAVAVGAANQEHASDVVHWVSGSAKVRSVVDILEHQRATYGAKLFLSWNMRDRSAAAFADYLEQRQREALVDTLDEAEGTGVPAHRVPGT